MQEKEQTTYATYYFAYAKIRSTFWWIPYDFKLVNLTDFWTLGSSQHEPDRYLENASSLPNMDEFSGNRFGTGEQS